MLIALALVVAPTGAFGASLDGGIGVRLVDIPTTATEDLRARIYVVDHLAPGALIQRRIEVSNDTRSSVDVALYAAGATLEGGSFLGAAGHTANALSTWTDVRPNALQVASGGREMVSVEIAVPPDAAPGEQYGVVWAEVRSTADPAGGLTHVSRVGIRLYISIGPGGEPEAGFTVDRITGARTTDGNPKVLAMVNNVGGRALDMSGTLDLSNGPGGLSAGPFPVSLGTTLGVGATGSVTVVLDRHLPPGPWDARITLRSGLLERSAGARITFPSVAATTSPGWLHVAIAVLVALLLLAISQVVRMRRRSVVVNAA